MPLSEDEQRILRQIEEQLQRDPSFGRDIRNHTANTRRTAIASAFGAVALLPIYATDVLKVGAQGLGIMRAAPSIGALIVAFLIAHLPPMKNAGRTLFIAVAHRGGRS